MARLALRRPPAKQQGLLRVSTGGVLVTTGGLLAVFVTTSLAPQLARELDVTPARLGLAVALFFATGTPAAPLCGRLADRVGSVLVIRLSLALASACLLSVALFVHGWVALVVVLGLAGVANGAIQPAANRYVSRLAPAHRQGVAFGIKQSAIPAAVLVGGLSVPVAAYLINWRTVYLVAAVVAMALGLVVRRPPLARERRRAETGVPRLSSASWRAVVLVAVGWGLASAGANGLGSFFVLGATDVGFSHVDAGYLAVAGALASIAIRVVVGLLADRSDRVGFALAAGMAAVGGLGLGLLATGQPWSFALAPVLGYGAGWGWPGLINYLVARAYPQHPGHATGVTQAGASAGACTGPFVFGLVVDYGGYPPAWLLAAALMLLSAVVILVAGRSLPTTRQGTAS